MRSSSKNHRSCVNAFTLIEVVVVVSLIGVIASAGYGVVSKISGKTRDQKLMSELAALNTSVASYVSFGGNLDETETAAAVFERLRSTVNSDIASRIPGLSSSMIDRRMTAIFQTAEEAATDQTRLHWNKDKRAFESATSGEPGIRAFFLADESEIAPPSEEETRHITMLYAERDSWIWDYHEQAPVAPAGPTIVNLSNSVPSNSETPPPVILPPTGDSTSKSLLAPIFSMPSGEYEISEFNLPVTLSNPNSAVTSDIYYAVNYGTWKRYTPGTTLDVGPDQHISAQAIAKSGNWRDSSRAEEEYSAISAELMPPTILTSTGAFGGISNRVIGLILENPNSDADGKLQYRINEGPWIDYTRYLLLDRTDFPNGASIAARVAPKVSYFQPSETASRIIGAAPLTLNGDANARFTNPVGDQQLVSNLLGQGSGTYFEWGDIPVGADLASNSWGKSSLQFSTAGSYDSELGESFYLGNLDYRNGTTLLDTNATGVDFELELAFAIDGSSYGTGFDFDFDIQTTANTSNPWESADFVAIDRANSLSLFEIDGSTFELSLSFGNTTEGGFSSTDSFHVFENDAASAELYATVFDRTTSRGNVNADGTVRDGNAGISEIEGMANQNGGWWSRLLNWLSSPWS